MVVDFFNKLTSTLVGFFNSYKITLIVLCIIAFILIIIVFLALWIGEKDEESKTPDRFMFQLPPLGGWISSFLSLKGVFKVNDLSLSFLKVQDFLKDAVGINRQYELPWFMVVGEEGSGKTTLVNNISSSKMIDNGDFYNGQKDPLCHWVFFNKGVVLDLKGNAFLSRDLTKTDDKTWRELSILLVRYRTARPLNGIILTISAQELYGKHKLDENEMVVRANAIAQKLSSFQHAIGMALPVYVVITKSDVLPGFQNTCGELLPQNRHNLLGWSNPYHTNQVYRKEWMAEAFNYIYSRLDYLRYEIFAMSPKADELDGVFIFPQELLKLQSSITSYCERIFQGSANEEQLILRGLYFCGDSGLKTLAKVILDKDTDKDNFPIPNTPSAQGAIQNHSTLSVNFEDMFDDSKVKRVVYFINDLFTHKIFLESGIAHPQPNKILTINRSLNVLKISTGVFLLIVSMGFYEAYTSLQKQQKNLIPILLRISRLIQDLDYVHLTKTKQAPQVFDKQARELLSMVNVIQDANFFSWLVPASWFSPLHRDLTKSLHSIYRQTIIRSLQGQLMIKAHNLLTLRPKANNVSTSLGQLLNPKASAEYHLFHYFVEEMRSLLDNVYKFNNLKGGVDYRDLDSIVSYAFGMKLPEEFKENYESFRNVLLNMELPHIDLKPYQGAARQTLWVLYDHLLSALFSKNNEKSLYSRLNFYFSYIEGISNQESIDIEQWRTLSQGLMLALPKIGPQGENWIDQEFFNLGKDYEKLLDTLDTIYFFGKEVTQYLVDQTDLGFTQFKNSLIGFNKLFQQEGVKNKDDQIKKIPPSYALMELEKSLHELFGQNFMDHLPPSNLSFTLPPDKILNWDESMLDQTYSMISKFEGYTNSKLRFYANYMQIFLTMLGRSSLQTNIVSTLGRAELLTPMPIDNSPTKVSEQILKNCITNFKKYGDKILKIITILQTQQKGSGVLAFDLQTLVRDHAYYLLGLVEQLLVSFNPYMIIDNNFTWWDGKPGAAFKAYAVKDMADLEDVLLAQRQYLNYLTMDYAKVLVMFILNPILGHGPKDNINLLNHWRRIVDQVEEYPKKKSNNFLMKLEGFITGSLVNFDPRTALDKIDLAVTKEPTGDFFLGIKNAIQQKFLERCEVLTRQEMLANYQDLSDFFNKILANRFPFTNGLNVEQGEADPQDIAEFYKKFDSYGGSTKKILNQIYQLGNFSKDMVDFIQKVEILREFFAPYLDGTSGDSVPSFDFTVDFRVNKGQEKNTNLIVGWTFKVGDDLVITKADKQRQGRWLYGQPIEIGFRWPIIQSLLNDLDNSAKNPASPKIPVPLVDSNQPYLSVNESQATFIYKGRWSLLWLLRMQSTQRTSTSGIYDSMPYLLKFSIPVDGNDRAVAFNLVSVMAPSDKPKQPGSIIRIPSFPVTAPSIPIDVQNMATQAVLATGRVVPAPLPNKELGPNQSPILKTKEGEKDIGDKPKEGEKDVAVKEKNN